jgi:hypothetical protein
MQTSHCFGFLAAVLVLRQMEVVAASIAVSTEGWIIFYEKQVKAMDNT